MLYSISIVGLLASVAASTRIQFYTTARLINSPRADDVFGIWVPSAQASRCGNEIAEGVRGQCLSPPNAEVGGIAGAVWNPQSVYERSALEERDGETTLPSEAFLADGTTFDINNGVPSERTEKIMDLLWLKGGFATVDDVPAGLVPFIKS
ncbi:hypothetical protein KC343_g2209 [Hortaea werneckii]|nr:hypothetical protein KC352_g10180 [Hortaea werneckii]KAI7570955.1 hypothetical protein KC317_g2034 [Hortaea werneckii]KAI7622167.1 hypothetical protein KC346_g3337 [Hortaea werneckii]KAI7634787.1 hypothetical protein KC343_g2209 [Hortaea werneckii]KAI7681461.1 hypothetical protein KC319_g1571 [Hortaea werneckii]